MAKPTTITVKIREATGDAELTRMSFHLGSVIDTIVDIETEVQNVVEALQAIITGDVVEVSFSRSLDVTGWTLAPTAGTATDRLVGARLIMNSIDPFYAQLNFPTFDLAKLESPASKDVDQADTEVAALLAALLGTTLTTNQDVEVTAVSEFYRTYGSKK